MKGNLQKEIRKETCHIFITKYSKYKKKKNRECNEHLIHTRFNKPQLFKIFASGLLKRKKKKLRNPVGASLVALPSIWPSSLTQQPPGEWPVIGDLEQFRVKI